MIGTLLVSRYELTQEIGRGGMGAVYRAVDHILEREVAVKLIPPGLMGSDSEERFRREAKVLARLEHPNIVGIHDLGHHEGTLFLVMPLISGPNLRHLLRQGGLSLRDVYDLGIQVAEALDYSHSRGILHRDVKPENILTVDGPEGFLAKLTDFGLAAGSGVAHITQAGTLIGTASYFSPEQVKGEVLDVRSDIYALATVVYECLAGRPPFVGDVHAVLYSIAHDEPQPLVQADPELWDLLTRCLAKEPMDRPQRARDLADGLARARASLTAVSYRLRPAAYTGQSTADHSDVTQEPILGRSVELKVLADTLDQAIAGTRELVLLAGEAGIGKTRLSDELECLARVRGVRVLRGRFAEEDHSIPYQAFGEAILDGVRQEHQLISHHSRPENEASQSWEDLAPGLMSLFPALVDLEPFRSLARRAIRPTQPEDKGAIFELLSRAVLRLQSGRPLVLILEDLHDAEASLDAIQFLLRRLVGTPTLILGTYRSTDIDRSHALHHMLQSLQGDPHARTLRLGPLAETAFREFVSQNLGPSVGDPLIQQLFSSSCGNPFVAREMIRALQDSGAIRMDSDGRWSFSGNEHESIQELPASVKEVVSHRINRLPESLQELLQLASVLGTSFDDRHLAHMAASDPEFEEHLEELLRRGFLEEERRDRVHGLRFTSPMVRDVLYAGIPRRRKRHLHALVVAELERRHKGRLERVLSDLVRHCAEADLPEKVIEYGFPLARREIQSFSADEVIRTCHRILDFLDPDLDPELEAEARILLAQGFKMAAQFQAALAELERAIRRYERSDKISEAMVAQVLAAETAWEGQLAEDARRHTERALQHRLSPELRLRVLKVAASLASIRGDYEGSDRYLDEINTLEGRGRSVISGGWIRIGLRTETRAVDPVQIRLDEEAEMLLNIFQPLVRVDENGQLSPVLASQIELLEGGHSVRVKLRPGLFFSDGSPLNAEALRGAVAASLRRAGDWALPGFSSIKGLQEFELSGDPSCLAIQVRGEWEVLFHLEKPLPLFPILVSDTRCAIAKETSQGRILGTGPFQMENQEGPELQLTPNPHYEPAPQLARLSFISGIPQPQLRSRLEAGSLDIAKDLTLSDEESLLASRDLLFRRLEFPKRGVGFILIHRESPKLKDPSIRKALLGTLPVQKLVEGLSHGQARPATGLFPPGIMGFDPGRRFSSLPEGEARELLQPLQLQLRALIHPVYFEKHRELLDGLLHFWKQLGVQVHTQHHPMPEYLELSRRGEGVDLLISRWFADYADPDDFTWAIFHTQMGRFREFLSDPELDRLTGAARTETDPKLRLEMYRGVESMLLGSHRILPLLYELDVRIVRSAVVAQQPTPVPPYFNYQRLGLVSPETELPLLRPAEAGQLQVPLTMDLSVKDLDPATTLTATQAETLPLVYECLAKVTDGAGIRPWLAASISALDQGRRYRIRLREGIRFHNGRVLSARDVRYSLERLLLHPEAAHFGALLEPIRGASAMLKGEARELSGFHMHSDLEFTLEMDRPLAFLPSLLAFEVTAIVPEGWDPGGDSWKTGAIGTGPFRIRRLESGRKLELEANPHYWIPGLPRLAGIHFHLAQSPVDIAEGFARGRFHVASELRTEDKEALRRDPDLQVRYCESPRLSTYFLVLNAHQGCFKDVTLRRSMFAMFDVETLTRRHLGRLGITASTLIPPGLLGLDPGFRSQSMIHRPVIHRAGAGIPLNLLAVQAYMGPFADLTREILEILRSSGFQVGQINSSMDGYMKALKEGRMDLLLARWTADYPDADSFAFSLLHSKNMYGKFVSSPQLDRLLEQARTEVDAEHRQSLYRSIEDHLRSEALVLPLFHEMAYRLARPEVEHFAVRYFAPSLPYEEIALQRD